MKPDLKTVKRLIMVLMERLVVFKEYSGTLAAIQDQFKTVLAFSDSEV